MIVIILLLILSGALSSAIILGLKGLSWGMIALGYVAGGWLGLLAGLPILLLAREVRRRQALRQDGQPAGENP